MDTPADRLKQARAVAGFRTATDAALRFGWNVNTYKSHENGQRNLRVDRVEQYASAFGVSPAWLQFGGSLTGQGDGEAVVQNVPGAAPAPSASSPSGGFEDERSVPCREDDVVIADLTTDGLVGDRDFPVYGSALGGPDGEMIVSYDPIEWARRPGPLMGVRNGFGFYMIGDSMSPAFEPGDMILCHPTRPPLPGQDVLVIVRAGTGEAALVKRLLRLDGRGVRLRQFNPAREFEVPREDLVSVHLVVGKYSRR
jgi:phage repressor protein C with HTH and peptisase S24 domain